MIAGSHALRPCVSMRSGGWRADGLDAVDAAVCLLADEDVHPAVPFGRLEPCIRTSESLLYEDAPVPA